MVNFSRLTLFFHFNMHFLHNYNMLSWSKEARIVIVIKALRRDQKLTVNKAEQVYDVPHMTLRHRINGKQSKTETGPKNQLLDELEEKVLV